MLLTPGNRKLGLDQLVIWGFGIPSRDTCPGKTQVCSKYCYSANVEARFPTVHAHYVRNLQASKRADFTSRLLAEIIANNAKVVRLHTAGDLYSAHYARKWLEVMRAAPHVRFFTYSRSWVIPSIRHVLVKMSRLKNVRIWYSIDRETGLPDKVPKRVRLAYLQTRQDEIPLTADLVFRTTFLRKNVQKWQPTFEGRALVCPEENGVKLAAGQMTCAQCQYCLRELSGEKPGRIPLQLAGI
jgi:hypothetical protein